MKIEQIGRVCGIEAAFTALRLPYQGNGDSRNVAGYFIPGQKDVQLLQTLIKLGDSHAKVMRGIIVYADITAPVYWWSELECYRFGHERLCSESTMNQEGRGLSGEELQKVKADIPMGRELRKIDMFSYQCLRNIWLQRQHHRLPEWHQFICWMHTLEMSEELIFVK